MATLTIELPDDVRRKLDGMAVANGYERAEDYLRAAIMAAAETAGPSLADFELRLLKAMRLLPQSANRQSREGSSFEQA